MSGLLGLVGGGEFLEPSEQMDRDILEASTPAHGAQRVAIVPAASEGKAAGLTAGNGVAYFTRLGVEAFSIVTVTANVAHDEVLAASVDETDVIYLPSGNPIKLVAVLSNSPLLACIISASRRGVTVVCSGAGAMALGSSFELSGHGFVPGFEMAEGIACISRHEEIERAELSARLSTEGPRGVIVIGLDTQTAILGTPGSWRVLGRGEATIYQYGAWTRHRAGEILALPE